MISCAGSWLMSRRGIEGFFECWCKLLFRSYAMPFNAPFEKEQSGRRRVTLSVGPDRPLQAETAPFADSAAGGQGAGSTLNTWKEIAAYLGVSARAAQNWERNQGLPIHRLKGEKARVWALPAELDSWRQGQVDSFSPQSSRRRLEWAAALACLLAVAGIAVWWAMRPGAPVRCETRGDWLIAFDRGNRRVWESRLPGIPLTPEHDTGNQSLLDPYRLVDLDGDGSAEVLFAFHSAGLRSGEGDLHCFGQDGRLLWTQEAGSEVRTVDGEALSAFWVPSWVSVLARPRPDGGRIVLVSHHVYSWPSRVAILTPQGRVVAEYWFPGWLVTGLLYDIDGDGEEEILLGGVNNSYSREPYEAAMVVLDAAFSSGQSPPAPGDRRQIAGVAVLPEAASLLFPRIPYPGPKGVTWLVRHLRPVGPALEVYVDGATPNGTRANIHYQFDSTLRMIGLTYDRSFEEDFAAVLPPAPDRSHQVTEAFGRILTPRNRFAR